MQILPSRWSHILWTLSGSFTIFDSNFLLRYFIPKLIIIFFFLPWCTEWNCWVSCGFLFWSSVGLCNRIVFVCLLCFRQDLNCVAQAILKLAVMLSRLSLCWDCKCQSPYPACMGILTRNVCLEQTALSCWHCYCEHLPNNKNFDFFCVSMTFQSHGWILEQCAYQPSRIYPLFWSMHSIGDWHSMSTVLHLIFWDMVSLGAQGSLIG